VRLPGYRPASAGRLLPREEIDLESLYVPSASRIEHAHVPFSRSTL